MLDPGFPFSISKTVEIPATLNQGCINSLFLQQPGGLAGHLDLSRPLLVSDFH